MSEPDLRSYVSELEKRLQIANRKLFVKDMQKQLNELKSKYDIIKKRKFDELENEIEKDLTSEQAHIQKSMFSEFFNECCILDVESETDLKLFMETFKCWCKEQSWLVMNNKKVEGQLKEFNCDVIRDRRVIRGLKLKHRM